MPEIRVYGVIRAQTTVAPSEAQWRAVGVNMAQQTGTLARQIFLYGQRWNTPDKMIAFDKTSQSAAQLRRYRMISFEIDAADVDEAQAYVATLAATRSITGTAMQKAAGILQAEAREAAVRLGFSVAQANTITVALQAFAEREAAMSAVWAYLAANAAIWYV